MFGSQMIVDGVQYHLYVCGDNYKTYQPQPLTEVNEMLTVSVQSELKSDSAVQGS